MPVACKTLPDGPLIFSNNATLKRVGLPKLVLYAVAETRTHVQYGCGSLFMVWLPSMAGDRNLFLSYRVLN